MNWPFVGSKNNWEFWSIDGGNCRYILKLPEMVSFIVSLYSRLNLQDLTRRVRITSPTSHAIPLAAFVDFRRQRYTVFSQSFSFPVDTLNAIFHCFFTPLGMDASSYFTTLKKSTTKFIDRLKAHTNPGPSKPGRLLGELQPPAIIFTCSDG